MNDPGGYVIDDYLAHDPLRTLGWVVDAVSWRTPGVPWNVYDAVVIRSTWDYVEAPDAFLDVLAGIEQAGAPLFNPLGLVRWNSQKTYLRDLVARGVPVAPTVYRDRIRPGELPDLFEALGTRELVLKPVVGANAAGAFRLDERAARQQPGEIEAYFADRSLLAQPFVTGVTTEGEYSLCYFNGEFSHAVLKTPGVADFRVQEEHGGSIRSAQPERALRLAGDAALRAIGDAPLYARADLVRADDGSGFWLMELELIEPTLYFRLDAGAPGRFARALHARVAGGAVR